MSVHILVVEDDENLRFMIVHILQKASYQVTQACRGEEAIELLRQAVSEERYYDLVLTDIVMEEVDGIEVMKVAHSQPYKPEVILLTGHGSLATAVQAVRSGAFDYILKPCPRDTLLERVAACVEYHKTRLRQLQRAELLDKITELIIGVQNLDNTAILQRPPARSEQPESLKRYMQVGLLHIDTHRHEVRFNGQHVHVTPTEYLILTCLAATPGQVVRYGDIIYRAQGYRLDEVEAHGLLRTHIRNLRRKFDRRYLVSVYAVGYMLVEPEESPSE